YYDWNNRLAGRVPRVKGYDELLTLGKPIALAELGLQDPSLSQSGTATAAFAGATGTYDVYVAYFDETDGVSHFEVRIGGTLVDSWDANLNLGSPAPNAQTLVRRKVASARSISNGTSIQITGTSNLGEFARVDYVDFVPSGTTGSGTVRMEAESMNLSVYV